MNYSVCRKEMEVNKNFHHKKRLYLKNIQEKSSFLYTKVDRDFFLYPGVF
jgi:hypothetical protein